MNWNNIKERTFMKLEVGSAKEDPTKAVTPMIFFSRLDAADGRVVTIGIGWWHWYIVLRSGLVS